MKKAFAWRILSALLAAWVLLAWTPLVQAQEEKQAFDLSQTRWSRDEKAPFLYDGTEHEVVLLGLPEGLTASYEDNRGTLPGQRQARAILSYDASRYHKPEVPPLDWSILLPAPEGVQLSGSREGVQVRWAPAPHIDGVEIHRSPLGEEHYERVYFGREDSFMDRGAAYGRAYQYRMRSFVAQSFFLGLYHFSDFGEPQSLVLLDQPQGLTAQVQKEGEGVQLTWKAVPGAKAYLVSREHRIGGLQTGLIHLDTVSEPALLDSLPYQDDAAYYRVAACLKGPEGLRPRPVSDMICLSLRPDSGLPGDANNDGQVDPLDLICLSDYLAHGIPCPSMGNADANGSGGKPDLVDLVHIANLIVEP